MPGPSTSRYLPSGDRRGVEVESGAVGDGDRRACDRGQAPVGMQAGSLAAAAAPVALVRHVDQPGRETATLTGVIPPEDTGWPASTGTPSAVRRRTEIWLLPASTASRYRPSWVTGQEAASSGVSSVSSHGCSLLRTRRGVTCGCQAVGDREPRTSSEPTVPHAERGLPGRSGACRSPAIASSAKRMTWLPRTGPREPWRQPRGRHRCGRRKLRRPRSRSCATWQERLTKHAEMPVMGAGVGDVFCQGW